MKPNTKSPRRRCPHGDRFRTISTNKCLICSSEHAMFVRIPRTKRERRP